MTTELVKMTETPEQNSYQPWLYEDDWQNGQIHSSARGMLYFSLFFTLFWNLIAFPVSYFAITDIYHGWHIDRLDPVLFVLLFPVVGLVLIVWAFKNYRQWVAFGRLSMTLDPYPGSIGGEVGGFVDLPVPWQSGYQFDVTINCIHHTIRRSGKNSSHQQDVVWRSFAAVDYEPAANGVRLKFKSPVDDGLYESEEDSGRSYYRWVVHIKGDLKPGMNMTLDRQFDIPVFRLDEPQKSHFTVMTAAPEMSVEQIDEKQVRITHGARSLKLEYPRSRNSTMGWGMFAVATIFLSVSGFLMYDTWIEINRSHGFSIFSAGMGGFMALVFGLVSLVMLAIAIHMLSNHLMVVIDAQGIRVRSNSLLHRSDKSTPLSEIRSIDKTSSMSSGQGVSSTRYFTLNAHLNNQQKITLGNGIKGQQAADSLTDLINRHIKSISGATPSIEAAQKTDIPFNDEQTREKIRFYIKKISIIANIVVALFILAFFYDIFRNFF